MVKPSRSHAATTTSSFNASSSGGTRARMPAAISDLVRVAVQLLVRRFANARARRVSLGDESVEAFTRERRVRIERDVFERAFDMRELRFEPGERLLEEAQCLEEPDDITANPSRRAKVDDVHRNAAADAIEPADALLDDRRFPRQVEQHEAPAELEIATLASTFGRYEEARTVRFPESRHFRISACGRQLLVEDAAGKLRTVTERRAQHLERLAVRHEDERLLLRVSPPGRLRQQPVEPRVAEVHRCRPVRGATARRAREGRRALLRMQANDGRGRLSGAARSHAARARFAGSSQRLRAAASLACPSSAT